jgi:hypothetical protein
MHTHSTSHSARGLSVLAILLILGACSRSVPPTFPNESPASADAKAAPTTDVTLSLDGAPPMPGEAAEGWIGLDQTDMPAQEGHGGHGSHASHAEPPKPAPHGDHHHGH